MFCSSIKLFSLTPSNNKLKYNSLTEDDIKDTGHTLGRKKHINVRKLMHYNQKNILGGVRINI